MNSNLQKLIELIQSKRKTDVTWKRQEATPQPFYTFSPYTRTWWKASPPSTTPSSENATPIDNIAVLSWNIEFMLPCGDERMLAALNHLQSHLASTTTPTVIFFQEMVVGDLTLIQSQSWIRSSYHLTDLDATHWESGHYGTCTLIPKSLTIASVFRVHYQATHMERDGLFVDINVGPSSSRKIVRLCNTHLESLIANPPLRPAQVTTAAQFMHAPEVAGSILAGDLNAIEPFDRTLHTDNDLHDAYLMLGGNEDSDDGYTWGQTASVRERDKFGCSRMDKVFFCGDAIQLVAFERVGLRVTVEDESVTKRLVEEMGLDGGWVTDHTAVKAQFRIVDVDATGPEDTMGKAIESKM